MYVSKKILQCFVWLLYTQVVFFKGVSFQEVCFWRGLSRSELLIWPEWVLNGVEVTGKSAIFSNHYFMKLKQPSRIILAHYPALPVSVYAFVPYWNLSYGVLLLQSFQLLLRAVIISKNPHKSQTKMLIFLTCVYIKHIWWLVTENHSNSCMWHFSQKARSPVSLDWCYQAEQYCKL